MKKITWYLNRLKAMNMGEICWRFQQKNLQKQERRKYYKEHQSRESGKNNGTYLL